MKYECNACGGEEKCTIDVQSTVYIDEMRCPDGETAADWQEVKE